MLLIDFSPGDVPVKLNSLQCVKVRRVKAAQMLESAQNENDLPAIGHALLEELKQAQVEGKFSVVGVPAKGEILKFIGMIQVLYGIKGCFPFVVQEKNGLYDVDQAMDLYDLMDSARWMRI
ncbi:hypothetical protein [Staphylospora marina]|uniref:hypothetical protein n=1 Tax=Staphylospora marina TaxID=2490858 RepID=UPI000F5C19C6|nr:hypothetical protein [Staphylospora marina]